MLLFQIVTRSVVCQHSCRAKLLISFSLLYHRRDLNLATLIRFPSFPVATAWQRDTAGSPTLFVTSSVLSLEDELLTKLFVFEDKPPPVSCVVDAERGPDFDVRV
jgi:hypothetical protein